MKVGPFIRSMFGPYERRISEAYRSIYLDIDALAFQVHRWCPNPNRILEVGCGEGAISQRLSAMYPSAKLIAIDVTSRIGRLYQGPSDKVRFIRCELDKIPADDAAPFDLVVLCDVLHHVPVDARSGLLDAIRATLAPDGRFVFKDWERSDSLIHWLCYASDRWLTGDQINYMSRQEMRRFLAESFGWDSLISETRVGPRWNNLAILLRPQQRHS